MLILYYFIRLLFIIIVCKCMYDGCMWACVPQYMYGVPITLWNSPVFPPPFTFSFQSMNSCFQACLASISIYRAISPSFPQIVFKQVQVLTQLPGCWRAFFYFYRRTLEMENFVSCSILTSKFKSGNSNRVCSTTFSIAPRTSPGPSTGQAK